MYFSIIIPVFNRPDELEELLLSIKTQTYTGGFEVIVVDDGSNTSYDEIVNQFKNDFKLKYYFKENSGPGDSRNKGMALATGDYFIILDSDCVLPEGYLEMTHKALTKYYTDAFGGPDAAHDSFNDKQKAINYSMTSKLTTGGLRGGQTNSKKFQLRSFNMGLSKKAFLETKGFSKQRIGEDIDLCFRLWEKGYDTQLLPEAFVYHKRRSSWMQFFKQTRNFGAARPILNRMHPGSARISYWLPSLFFLGTMLSIVCAIWQVYFPLMVYGVYFLLVFLDSFVKNRRFSIAVLSIFSVNVQFYGYGMGFLRSVYRLSIKRMDITRTFPKMFP